MWDEIGEEELWSFLYDWSKPFRSTLARMIKMMTIIIVIINKLVESQTQGPWIVKSACSIQQLGHWCPFRGMVVQIPWNTMLNMIITSRLVKKFLIYMDLKIVWICSQQLTFRPWLTQDSVHNLTARFFRIHFNIILTHSYTYVSEDLTSL
jgi:hypothetical protein